MCAAAAGLLAERAASLPHAVRGRARLRARAARAELLAAARDRARPAHAAAAGGGVRRVRATERRGCVGSGGASRGRGAGRAGRGRCSSACSLPCAVGLRIRAGRVELRRAEPAGV
eukprot:6696406-Prymnesium_polylepis.1